MGKTFKEFMLEEGLRQDALVHNVAGQLGTKTGLYMVFAAFIFGTLSTIAVTADKAPWRIWTAGIWIAAMVALAGIAALLRCSFMEKYRMPPILPRLNTQAKEFFSLRAVRDLPEERKQEEFLQKFTNSLSRSIEDNFNANARITKQLDWASRLIAISMVALLASLLYFPLIHAFQWFHHLWNV